MSSYITLEFSCHVISDDAAFRHLHDDINSNDEQILVHSLNKKTFIKKRISLHFFESNAPRAILSV